MRDQIVKSLAALGCMCIFIVLICTFFVSETYAASTISGTTTKKEQTVAVDLVKGSAVVTVSDADSWVFGQIQETGGDKIGQAIGGEKALAPLGQQKTFVVPVKKAGTYYLYLHGQNEGAAYKISSVKPGGTLKSGTPKRSTSYADNKSVVWHTIKVSNTGSLRVTVNDASYRYAGYSKVRLKKGDEVISGDEYLIRGLGFSTVYGVSEGTYKIGVRSSSELYKITAELTDITPAEFSTTKKKAPILKRKAKTYGVIEPGDTTVRWYRVDLPAKTAEAKNRKVLIQADNSNPLTTSGIDFKLYFKKTADKDSETVRTQHLMNNVSSDLNFGLFKKDIRTVYIRVAPVNGSSGTYMIQWR